MINQNLKKFLQAKRGFSKKITSRPLSTKASGISFLLASCTKIESKIAKLLCNISSQNLLTFPL